MINNIKSNLILKIIIKNHLRKKTYFALAKINKKLQKKLDMNLDTYKHYFKIIEIELFPISYLQLELENKYYFIKIKNNRESCHIYFNDNKEKKITRNYITKDDKVNKINIELDEGIKTLNGLFYECDVLKEIKFTKFNRNDFTDFSNMFYGCRFLSSLDIKKLKTRNVTDMKWMFALCPSLTELNIINFDTSKVTDMTSLFSGCIRLKNIIANFNMAKVKYKRGMFFRCESFDQTRNDFNIISEHCIIF